MAQHLFTSNDPYDCPRCAYCDVREGSLKAQGACEVRGR